MDNNVTSPRERGRDAMVRHRLSPDTRARWSLCWPELSAGPNPLSVTGSSKEAQDGGEPKARPVRRGEDAVRPDAPGRPVLSTLVHCGPPGSQRWASTRKVSRWGPWPWKRMLEGDHTYSQRCHRGAAERWGEVQRGAALLWGDPRQDQQSWVGAPGRRPCVGELGGGCSVWGTKLICGTAKSPSNSITFISTLLIWAAFSCFKISRGLPNIILKINGTRFSCAPNARSSITPILAPRGGARPPRPPSLPPS